MSASTWDGTERRAEQRANWFSQLNPTKQAALALGTALSTGIMLASMFFAWTLGNRMNEHIGLEGHPYSLMDSIGNVSNSFTAFVERSEASDIRTQCLLRELINAVEDRGAQISSCI